MEDQPGIDVPAALARLGGNRGLLMRLLAEFGKTQADAAAAIRAALGRGDIDDAMRRAHTVKGVAGNLSAVRLAAVAGAVEMRLRAGDAAGAAPLLVDLEDAMGEILTGLTPEPAAAPTPAANAAPGTDLAGMMAALDALLGRNSLAARREAAPLIAALSARGADGGPLAAAIDRLAFAEARQALRTVAASFAIALPVL
jgi:HPt (histidine-containing phosphotransfer) domain-containing protein